MIQRIQTIYLLIAFIAISLLFSKLPIASYELNNIGKIYFNVIPSYQSPELSQNLFTNISTLPIIINIAILLLLIVFTILMYKNRPLQIKINMFAFLLNIVLIVVLFFTADSMQKQLNSEAAYKFGIALPLISLVFLILSAKAIKKDEKLVKAADRLR